MRLLDLVSFCGLAAFTYGCGLIYPPLWYVVGGAGVFIVAELASAKTRPHGHGGILQ